MALTHEARVIRCLDWLFSRINRDRGFMTRGVTTHRYTGDNRRYANEQDRAKSYADTCCMISFRVGQGEKDPKIADYGRQRQRTIIVVDVQQSLHKKDETEGLKLDDSMSALRTDIREALWSDPGLDTSWAQVQTIDPTLADLAKPSVVYLMVDGWEPQSLESQDGKQIIFVGYDYDERVTARTLV